MVETDVVRNELLAFRVVAPGHAAAVVLNLGDAAAEVSLPLEAAEVRAGDATVHPADDGTVRVSVGPHGFVFLS